MARVINLDADDIRKVPIAKLVEKLIIEARTHLKEEDGILSEIKIVLSRYANVVEIITERVVIEPVVKITWEGL